jgi:hypothetical protein
MMTTLQIILWVLAGIAFFLAGVGVVFRKTSIGWIGAFLIVVAVLIGQM